MNRKLSFSIIICLATLSFSAFADTPEETAKKTLITVNLQEAPVAQTLQFISDVSGVKVHYTAPAKGDLITLNVKDIPAAEALKYVARLSNLSIIYKDDGAYLTPNK